MGKCHLTYIRPERICYVMACDVFMHLLKILKTCEVYNSGKFKNSTCIIVHNIISEQNKPTKPQRYFKLLQSPPRLSVQRLLQSRH